MLSTQTFFWVLYSFDCISLLNGVSVQSCSSCSVHCNGTLLILCLLQIFYWLVIMSRYSMTKFLKADPLASLTFLLQLPFPYQSLSQITTGSNLLFGISMKLDFISNIIFFFFPPDDE